MLQFNIVEPLLIKTIYARTGKCVCEKGELCMKRERIDQIADLLDKRGKLSLEQLEEHFPDMSQMTLRRDLVLLEQQQRIIRIRGGAMSVKEVQKVSGEAYAKKTAIHTDEKIQISRKAASLIEENSCLFMDEGTTSMYLAKELPDFNLHVFTNGLAVAVELAKKKNFDVTMCGGQVLKDNLSTATAVSRICFENTNFELAVISASAFTPESGFSCGSQIEADFLQEVQRRAKAVYMMLDSSKIGKIMPHTFAHMDDIDVLITDANFPDDIKKLFVDKNIVVM